MVALHTAFSLLSATAPQPEIVVPLSVNATVPVGVPEEVETVAVNETVLFGAVVKAGFKLDETVVEVGVVVAYVTIISHELMFIGVVSPSPFSIVNVH